MDGCKANEEEKGCEAVSLDLDNDAGGLNGAETVTLEDFPDNSKYLYMIAIENFDMEKGDEFFKSEAQITITNGKKTKTTKISSGNKKHTDDVFFFGCLAVDKRGDFEWDTVSMGASFDAHNKEKILKQAKNYCGLGIIHKKF